MPSHIAVRILISTGDFDQERLELTDSEWTLLERDSRFDHTRQENKGDWSRRAGSYAARPGRHGENRGVGLKRCWRIRLYFV